MVTEPNIVDKGKQRVLIEPKVITPPIPKKPSKSRPLLSAIIVVKLGTHVPFAINGLLVKRNQAIVRPSLNSSK